MPAVDVDRVERLARLGLFSGVPHEQLKAIAEHYGEQTYGEGEWIIREGDPCHGLFIVLAGEAAAVIADEEISKIGTGSFFGEVAALLGDNASASVVTRSELCVLLIPPNDVERFLVEHPTVTLQMLRTEARRLQAASRWRGL